MDFLLQTMHTENRGMNSAIKRRREGWWERERHIERMRTGRKLIVSLDTYIVDGNAGWLHMEAGLLQRYYVLEIPNGGNFVAIIRVV
jgi:hypothetical protein